MGAVKDRLNIDLAEVKAFLHIDGDDEDIVLQTLIDAAKEAADGFLNNDFLDAEGNPKPIPAAVKLWVLKRVARSYERRAEGVESQRDEVGAVQWGPEEYAELWPWRRNPGL